MLEENKDTNAEKGAQKKRLAFAKKMLICLESMGLNTCGKELIATLLVTEDSLKPKNLMKELWSGDVLESKMLASFAKWMER